MVHCMGDSRERQGRGENGDDAQVSSFNDLAVNGEWRRTDGFENKDLEALAWRYMEVMK